jgi:hypothetical protein
MRLISGGIVAVKNKVCRVNGTSLQTRSMSGMKPMSSMRSASSMTSSSTPVSSSPPRSVWSSRRPGVAIKDVDAAGQFGVLVAERDAADQERDVEFLADAVFVEILFDLGREFAGRFEDQGAGHSCPGAALFQKREHGQDEGGGLAGAGLGDAEDVAAGQNVRDRLFLDGGRGRVTGSRNSGENLIGKSEMGKRH